ncbi:MAG: radical SAM protein, partial [Myxococcota bacterium]|nr:radical SAM protein [Myxococcota bacterium]
MLGQHDLARYRATLYLEDVADLVTATVDPGFGIARYQHHLAHGPVSYDPIAARLAGCTLLDAWLDELTDAALEGGPDVVGLSVPFPGTLYGALRIGQRARSAGAYVVLGGGYVNTELREVDEARLWDAVDALTYDDGEGPLEAILTHLQGGGDHRHRTRTFAGLHENPPPERTFNPAPTYGDLPLGSYLQVLDTLNPAQRLWGDARWNKLTLAHGCYRKRCAFCDVNLDYIARYEPARVSELVDAMEELVAETGQTGFHLVDEAAPPRLLRDLALAILARGISVHFWGNIRFERAFTPDLCRLLAAAGLTAVTGGLEVASDRLLTTMDKGITVAQAARAAAAFTDAGVLVHAYLMYGFPSQTAQETIDAMEVVRQLFDAGVLGSAFWHRFVLTRGSRVYADPDAYGVRVDPPGTVFAM